MPIEVARIEPNFQRAPNFVPKFDEHLKVFNDIKTALKAISEQSQFDADKELSVAKVKFV